MRGWGGRKWWMISRKQFLDSNHKLIRPFTTKNFLHSIFRHKKLDKGTKFHCDSSGNFFFWDRIFHRGVKSDPLAWFRVNPILTWGASGDLHPTFFKVAKNWMFGPYMILKRKIEHFSRKILTYVPFRWDLPFFAIWFQIFFHSHTSERLFFKVL